MPQPTSPVRYFIVDDGDLSTHGDDRGFTRAEAEAMLASYAEDDGTESLENYTIIKGEIVQPEVQSTVVLP